MNDQRGYSPIVVARMGKLYAIGGQGVSSRAQRTAEEYDPKTDTWSYIPKLPPIDLSPRVTGGLLYTSINK